MRRASARDASSLVFIPGGENVIVSIQALPSSETQPQPTLESLILLGHATRISSDPADRRDCISRIESLRDSSVPLCDLHLVPARTSSSCRTCKSTLPRSRYIACFCTLNSSISGSCRATKNGSHPVHCVQELSARFTLQQREHHLLTS